MSLDYSIYLKHTDAFSIQSFEQYCESLGLCISAPPEFDLLKDSGFFPMRLTDTRFVKDGENASFLSGFELFSSEYHPVTPPQKRKASIFRKPLRTAPVEETPLVRAVKDSSVEVDLSCGSADSFEVLMAYVFGAYLVKDCGGVFVDSQSGQIYDDYCHLENEISAIQEYLLNQANTGRLHTHEFTEWI